MPPLSGASRRQAQADLIEPQGEELFKRMVFNILIDNTDDREKDPDPLVDAGQRNRKARRRRR